MTAAMRRLGVLLVLLLAGCARGPTFDEVAATLPPLPANQGRLFVYRAFEPYQNLAWVPVFLNAQTIGAVGPGHVIMRDVPPGPYRLEPKSDGLWPNQASMFNLLPGQTVYAKITSFNSVDPSSSSSDLITTFVINLVDPTVGRSEIGSLQYSAQLRRTPAG